MIVKVCGVRSVEQAGMVLRAGADWIGLNLVGGPRQIDLQTAESILVSVAERERAVVLWELRSSGETSAERRWSETLDRLQSLGVQRLQLYGVRRPADFQRLSDRGFETIVVRHIDTERTVAECNDFLTACKGVRPAYVLLDSQGEGQLGGTGRRVGLTILNRCRASGAFAGWPPILLAGGLTPENVGEGIEALRPIGVDVSSGVESKPGVKDESRVRAFVESAHRAAT